MSSGWTIWGPPSTVDTPVPLLRIEAYMDSAGRGRRVAEVSVLVVKVWKVGMVSTVWMMWVCVKVLLSMMVARLDSVSTHRAGCPASW